MQTTTLSFANLHNHGDLFANVFRARKQSFIIQKNWDRPQTEEMEFDQYDTPMSRWVAIHELGQVYAGVRLTPTTARCGVYSYMIKDAQAGLLGSSIPQDLLYENAPVEAGTWEASRLFVDHSTPQAKRRHVHRHLVTEMSASARALGATKLVALVAASWERWLLPTGLEAQAIGREMWIDDGYFQCVSINLAQKMH
ncbi:acyl-homoserine-lactone synthase [Paracoccus aminophilus]|uniref:N-acyl-L-homoserine lactone synthetase n=1 Tax=Paracoccus aminophilus JCM 7686 TaxID=1367847 RepID=S5XY31_PARAH|nr:acyl-homoserine-lactone synthase [Paracoccus aminophilus]AGT10217.1 N-acyl-L-homoserine lactone synthetase [Paracoccus aminophilus JCM 7686]